MGVQHLVVDGSNIATEGRSLPSLQQLLDAVDAAEKELKPETVTVIVDATFGHRIEKDEREEYEQRTNTGAIITPPAGVIGRGDAFILEVADRADAVVLSNDSFQEFHGEYRWLFDEGRLLGGKHVPGVGWIFLARSPVRGPASRKSVSEAKKKKRGSKKAASSGPKKKASRSSKRSKATSKSGASGSGSGSKRTSKRTSKSGSTSGSKKAGDNQPRKGGSEPEPYNEPMPFIEFVGSHPVGAAVTAEVEQFSSHGAYVVVGDTRCYVPLKAMADPAPRSARDVLTLGESREFVVDAIDTPRRGIDLAIPGYAIADAADLTEADAAHVAEVAGDDDSARPTPDTDRAEASADATPADEKKLSVSQRRKLRAQQAAAAEETDGSSETPRETMAAKKKATKKRAPAKKKGAAKKKAPAKKATKRSR